LLEAEGRTMTAESCGNILVALAGLVLGVEWLGRASRGSSLQ
jgi:hypothetical protein